MRGPNAPGIVAVTKRVGDYWWKVAKPGESFSLFGVVLFVRADSPPGGAGASAGGAHNKEGGLGSSNLPRRSAIVNG